MLSEYVSANTGIAQVVCQRIPHRRTNHKRKPVGWQIEVVMFLQSQSQYDICIAPLLKLKVKSEILIWSALQGNLTSRALQSPEVAVDRQAPVVLQR